MAKKDFIISPAGRALYPKLKDPDTKFKPAGEYSVKLILSEADALPILEMCKRIQQEAFDAEFEKQRSDKPKMNPDKIREGIKLANLPVKPYEDPETGEETGNYQVTFKMNATGIARKTGKPFTRCPVLFDARNKLIDRMKIDVGSGSILKVGYTAAPFSKPATGTGVSLRLEAVQVLELTSWGQRDASAFGFEADEDGYSYDAKDDGDDSGFPFVGDDGEDTTPGASDF